MFQSKAPTLWILLIFIASRIATSLQYVPLHSISKCSHGKSQIRRSRDDFKTKTFKMGSFDLTDANVITESILALSVGSVLLLRAAVYWRMQFAMASLMAGIPTDSNIVEIDALDGKNVFYLPKGSDYTAIMKINEKDPNKQAEKFRFNEQLILECVGKSNSNGNLKIKAKVRKMVNEIQSKSADCVVSNGAIDRATEKVELINEVYRILRPGGLFVFIEPDKDNFMEKLFMVFPEWIKGGISAGEKERKAKVNRLIENEEQQKAKGSKFGQKKLTILEDLEMLKESNRANADLIENDKKIEVLEKVDVKKGKRKKNRNESILKEYIDGPLVRTDDDVDVDEERRIRPGVTYTRMSNLIFPYWTGIAIRP